MTIISDSLIQLLYKFHFVSDSLKMVSWTKLASIVVKTGNNVICKWIVYNVKSCFVPSEEDLRRPAITFKCGERMQFLFEPRHDFGISDNLL